MVMLVQEIKQKQVTALRSGTSYEGQTVLTINQLQQVSEVWKDRVAAVRRMEYHSDRQKKAKKMFPCWTPAGVFAQGSVKDESIIQHSNLVAIDVDGVDNPGVDMDAVKKTLCELPYVVMVMKGISGMGVFALMLVEDGHYTKEYCQYIERLWKQQYGLSIDTKCYNVGRKRFISWDDDALIKGDDVDITPWRLKYVAPVKPVTPFQQLYCPRHVADDDELDKTFEERVKKMIECGFDIGPHWSDWMRLGRCFKPFPNGLALFNELSSKMSAYNPKTFMKDWNAVRDEFDKNHAIAYVTLLLNERCPGWRLNRRVGDSLFFTEQSPI